MIFIEEAHAFSLFLIDYHEIKTISHLCIFSGNLFTQISEQLCHYAASWRNRRESNPEKRVSHYPDCKKIGEKQEVDVPDV